MKKILLTAMIAGALFSCSKEDKIDQQNPIGENSITLVVKQRDSGRSISDQKGNTDYAVIGSARIYFINNVGTKVYQRDLTTIELATIANDETSAGNKSITITGVPNTATNLFFLANVKTTDFPLFPSIDGTTSNDGRIRIDKLQANVINVPMSGLSTAFLPTTPGATTFTTNVTITPIVSRLEIGQVTCKNESGTGATINADIRGYKLSGIFINNVSPSVMLDGKPYLTEIPVDIRHQAGWNLTGWESYFDSANSVFPYYTGGSIAVPSGWAAKAMVDYCTPTGAIALSFYPDSSNGSTSTDPNLAKKQAWAYQVVPNGASASNIPHIILKLTEVDYIADPFGKAIKYVTVTKYKNEDGIPITQFLPGNIYRISNLTFTHNEATEVPYDKNINVTATVTVAHWVLNEMNPDWN